MTFVLYSLNLNWGTAKKQLFIGFGLFCMIAILHTELLFAEKQVPLNLFNIGDSIGEGEAAYNDIGQFHHELVWSTGYDSSDQIESFNERFEQINATRFLENTAERDPAFNHARSGSTMADFEAQAEQIVAAAELMPSGQAGMITILLGANDVCASSLEAMTSPGSFEDQYRAGLNALAESAATQNAFLHVSSIPGIYWLWVAKRTDNWCRFVWSFVPCENLLQNPTNDCGAGESHLKPDVIYPDDGPNCIRRKQFHAKIRDIYNPILRDVLQEYKLDNRLPNAEYIDIFDIQFQDTDINTGDCFHPSAAGMSKMASEQWCRSRWGQFDPQCPAPLLPAIYLLLL